MDLPFSREQLEQLSPEKRLEAERIVALLVEARERNPLEGFHACVQDCGLPGCTVHPKQNEFLRARTFTQAAFAGNSFGKTVGLVVKCYVQHVPREDLPKRLGPFKLLDRAGVTGRLMCPSEKVLVSTVLPTLREWAPRDYLLGTSFDRAWDKANTTLRFKDGGALQVFTYQQDPDKLVGATLDYAAYDEPPPEQHRNENLARLVRREGTFEMFALTPINMTGGGIGWLWRDIWKRREHPDVTVVQGAIHDNPTLPRDRIELVLSQFSEEERRAREFGEFIHFGGMVYPGGFERVLVDAPAPEDLRDRDVVVGIDPGLKNAAFVWCAFDFDNRCLVFDEVLLKESTPVDYANAIRSTNERWGVADPMYVIDPSARNRSLVNAESIEAELNRQGIYPSHGQNQVEAGVQQVRRRMQEQGLFVSRECRGLRGEAEEYRAEDRPDGEFKPVKENDHRLDALRYAVMSRPWYAASSLEDDGPLGWVPGTAIDFEKLARAPRAPTLI